MPSLTEISAALRAADLAALPALKVTVLRNITVDTLVPYLQFEALQLGFRADVVMDDFDHIAQAALSPDGVPADSDFVLVFMHGPSAAPTLWSGFAGLTPADADAEEAFLRQQAIAVIQGVRRQTGATLLWHAFEQPIAPALGVLDAQREDGQAARILRLNAAIGHALREAGNAYLVDVDGVTRQLGIAAHDARYWHLARSPYARPALELLAAQHAAFIRALRGKGRKCLVLDCDNTLWGGVVGEDGWDGVEIGSNNPGSCYREFQQAALDLSHRGVILALCSKNNEADAWEVFDRREEMVLRREHIAAAAINWNDKPSNLMALAEQLNIGLDSFVFVDDSPLEVSLVRGALPQVHVIDLSVLKPTGYARALRECRLFDSLTFSADDRERTATYRAQVERHALASSAGDLSDYLRVLDMQVVVGRARPGDLPRLSQLTQRTNQFNLTTRRLDEAQVKALAEGPDSDVFYVQLSDRFGAVGTIGAAIVEYGDAAEIHSFLMSCRALGRGVEDVFLDQVLRQCAGRAETARASYRVTAKNAQTEGFFPRHGFGTLEQGDAGADYVLDLASWAGVEFPGHVRFDEEGE